MSSEVGEFISLTLHSREDRNGPIIMFANLIFILALAAGAWSAQYPAGLYPAVCPNYPYCDMELMAQFTPSGMPIPPWVSNPSLLPTDSNSIAPKYPAGLHPAVFLDYPYCDTDLLARYNPSGIPIPQWELNPSLLPVAPTESRSEDTTSKYPAGIHPAICLNYPYCDADLLARYSPLGIPIPQWELNASLLPVAPTESTSEDTTSNYPARLHPAICPNYPYCEADVLAQYTPSGIPIPQWELNPSLLPVAPTESTSEDTTSKYPAGLHPAICPNYPYCDTDILERYTPSGIPIPQWELNPSLLSVAPTESTSQGTAPKYPAELHPAVCPNYPYCDADVFARFTASGIPIPQGESNPSLLPAAATDCSSHTVDAAPEYPADMDPALCPNYPYCW